MNQLKKEVIKRFGIDALLLFVHSISAMQSRILLSLPCGNDMESRDWRVVAVMFFIERF
jgi:hypothetical protein